MLERLGTTAENWQARMEKLSKGRFLGRFFAARRLRLREVANRLGLRRVPNLYSSNGRIPKRACGTPLAFVVAHRQDEVQCRVPLRGH